MNNVVYVVYLALMIYGWLIVARALLSWFPQRPGSALFRLQGVLFTLTEPYLAFFRRLLPPGRFGSVGIDWSFLVGLLVVFAATQLVGRL
jgi:YggT family protein